jgi:hypothetical protein
VHSRVGELRTAAHGIIPDIVLAKKLLIQSSLNLIETAYAIDAKRKEVTIQSAEWHA